MPAYFEFIDSHQDRFVIRLEDEKKIAEARAILSGELPQKHVQGTIIKDRALYNPDWDYHLEPRSISFFELAIEVCDASVRYVQDHLAQVGTDFLPRAHWCPWSSRLTREVRDLADEDNNRELGLTETT
ncbi:MAG: calmodulin [Verrucomicrobia bacterium]|nr:calmodulin [Verrucomicrobiota bacterium]MBV8278060.1 calmodulin [Verrucomicrobiota bacterium]